MRAIVETQILVLDRYNTFDVIQRVCRSPPPATSRPVVIRPQHEFRPSKVRRLLARVGRKLPQTFCSR
jgi:hypothetical protein